MSIIETAGALRPGTTNTPLDQRSRVSTLAELMTITLPYVGLIVYCEEDHRYYRITGLKSAQIGSLSVADAAVASYEPLSSAILSLAKPANGLHLIIRRAGEDGTRANSMVIIDTLNDENARSKVTAYLDSGTDGSWINIPAEGFGSPFDNAAIAVDLSDLQDLPATLFYAWSGEGGELSDWQSIIFPCSGGSSGNLTAGSSLPGIPADIPTQNFSIAQVDYLPENPDATTLYLIPLE
ncbi:MAG: hypothetical protein IKC05_08800 [Lentisphaeria bacterium]|nr:hypothetical protein [Lentisphaeria bacterium]